MRSTAAPYTEPRLIHSVANECVGFPVVEQGGNSKNEKKFMFVSKSPSPIYSAFTLFFMMGSTSLKFKSMFSLLLTT